MSKPQETVHDSTNTRFIFRQINNFAQMTLYQTLDGKFFLVTHNGSQYDQRHVQDLSCDEAYTYCQGHLFADTMQMLFGKT